MLDLNKTILLLSADWVDVANDLLSKCHINLRLRKLTDCDANVFIALYENILGEKVPGKCKLQLTDKKERVTVFIRQWKSDCVHIQHFFQPGAG